jgi:hypothetical protein
MKAICALICTAAASLAGSASAQEVDAVPSQWFTGTLEAPSPALPKAGLLALEPYVVYQTDRGAYADSGSHISTAHDTSTLESLLVVKYGITDRLSIEALPSISHSRNNLTSSSGVSLGDLPLELEYRAKNGDKKTGAPSVTFDLGVTLPTGEYDHLGTPLNGVGSGAYMLKEGVVLQSLFDSWGNHPMRIRVYGAAYEPLSRPSVQDVSVYGTGQGFSGNVKPGMSGVLGIGAAYALNQRWVLALDLVQNYAGGYFLNGFDGLGAGVSTHGANQSSTVLAPAVEYSWSGKAGIIAGVAFTAAGRNTPAYVAPQIALAVAF